MSSLIKIYGERHTNTNYLSKLIALNIHATELPGVVPRYVWKLQRAVPGRESLPDMYFATTFGCNLGWKHSRAKAVEELSRERIVRRGVGFVTVTKNPYSWLLSLYRKPYHNRYGEKPPFEEFLSRPWKTVRRDNCSSVLSSPVELWNLKNESYLRLGDLNCLNVTVEQMLQDPGALIRSVRTHLGLPALSDSFVNFEQSTKDKSKNFGFYRDYYLNERWRENLSADAISIINRKLDPKLVERFGYELL